MPGYTPPAPYGALSGQQGFGQGLQFIDEVLSTLAKQYAPSGYVYDQIFSPMQVDFNIGRYPVFDPAAFFASGGNLAVADDAPTPIIDFKWSHDVYECTDKRLQTRITRKENVQASPVLKLEYSKTRGLMSVFATNREVRAANLLRAQSNGGQFTQAAVTPSVKWDTGTSGTPATIQTDLQAAALACKKFCGMRPNTLVMDEMVAMAIANDFTLKDLIKYQIGAKIIDDPMAAVLPNKLFGFRVIIAGAMLNSARPGDAMLATGVWGNSVRMVYTNPTAGWGEPATAYSFRGRVTDGPTQAPSTVMPSGDGGQEPGPAGGWALVDRWWDYDPPGEHIRAWECVDERVVAPELGVELNNVLANPPY